MSHKQIRYHMEFDLDLRHPCDEKNIVKSIREAVDAAIKSQNGKARNVVIANKREINYD